MPPPDESTSLLPEARPALNCRQKCCKFSYWPLCFGYFLLLLADTAASIYKVELVLVDIDTFIKLQKPDASAPITKEVDDFLKKFEYNLVVGIVLIFIDTCICWIFLGIVARSPHFVGCFTILKNLIRLPRFWSLVFLVMLYITGAVLALLLPFSGALRSQDALMKVIKILVAMKAVMELLNIFTKLALVGALNHVQLQNVARSRFQYSLLKVTLIVTWFFQFCALIGATWIVYFGFIRVNATGNSYEQQVISSRQAVMELLLLPFVIRTTELIWTKIFQDNECIIGKNESNRFTRHNPRISYAIEII